MLFWWYHHKKLFILTKKVKKWFFLFGYFLKNAFFGGCRWISRYFPQIQAFCRYLQLILIILPQKKCGKLQANSKKCQFYKQSGNRQKWSKSGPEARKLRNSETKSLKIDPKEPNRRYRQGLQTGHWRNPGSYSKKRIFGQKSGPVAGKRPAERPNSH